MQFVQMKGKGVIGQLVMVRRIKSLYHDNILNETIEEPYDERFIGFIIDLHEYIDDYYLIRYFCGAIEWAWKVDILERKNKEIFYLTNTDSML